MGIKESRSYKPPTFKKQSWREIKASKQAGKPEHGRYRLLINNLTNEQLEEYILTFYNLAEFQKYLEFFQWRQREDSIVNTKYLNYELSKQFCTTNYSAKVYIEHIPVRLSDIEDIPYPENLYVLFSSLDGFEKLYQSVGYFRVTEDLICMDKDGRVKVWLHSDLSQCHPSGRSLEEAKNYRRQETLEAKMVDEIVRIIEENTAKDIEPDLSVSDFIRCNHKGKPLNFKLIKQEIINYAQNYDAEIPNYFESVIGIFDENGTENDEQSAQQLMQPPYFNNDKSNDEMREQNHFRNEATEQWQSNHVARRSEEKVTEKCPDYLSYQKVFSAQPYNQFEYRPNSDLYYQHQAKQNVFPSSQVTYQQGECIRSQPVMQLDHKSRAQSPITNLAKPIQIGTFNSTNLKINFNYQANQPLSLPLQTQKLYTSPVSPISQLVTPQTIAIKKVTSIPDETQRVQEPTQQQFDAKMVLSSSLKNLLTNNRLVYSDSTSTYELDSELAEDMVKYLNS